MGISIKLDTNAVKYLIEQDQSFKLDLQSAVLSQILKNVIVRNPVDLLKDAYPDAFMKLKQSVDEEKVCEEIIRKLTEKRSGNWQKTIKLPAGVRSHIKSHSELKIKSAAEKEIRENIRPFLDETVERLKPYYKDQIEGAVNKLVNDELVRITRAKVAEAFKD